MPKIPVYISEVAPSVQYDPTAGLEGAQIQKTSSQLAEIVDAFDKAQRLDQHNRGALKILKGLEEIKSKYSEDTDFYTIEERAKKDIDELRQRVLKETPNPIVAKSLGDGFDVDAIGSLNEIKGYANKGKISSLQESGFAILDEYKKAYAKAVTPQTKQLYKTKITDELDALVAGGAIFPHQRQAIEQKLWADAHREEVFATLDRIGPVATLKLLKSGSFELGVEERFELEREIGFEVKRLEQEQKKQASGAYEITNENLAGEIWKKILYWEGPQITLEELGKYHGAGIGTDKFRPMETELQKRLKESPDEIMRNSRRLFQLAYRGGKFGDPKGKEASMKWFNAINQFEQRVKDENAKGERISEIAKEILKPTNENWVKKLLSEAIGYTPVGFAIKKIVGKKVLDEETAQAILDEAGGDPEKARKIAKDRGYDF